MTTVDQMTQVAREFTMSTAGDGDDQSFVELALTQRRARRRKSSAQTLLVALACVSLLQIAAEFSTGGRFIPLMVFLWSIAFGLAVSGWGLRSGGRLQVLGYSFVWACTLPCTFAVGLQFHKPKDPFFMLAGSGMLVALAGALLLVERGSLGGAAFRASAYRVVLMLSLVLALGDAFFLAGVGVWHMRLWPLLLACLMFACAEGLYRLKVGALFAAWWINPLVVFAMFYALKQFPEGRPLPADDRNFRSMLGAGVGLLGATTVIQFLLPIPVIVSMIRGRAAVRTRIAGRGDQIVAGILWGLVAMAVCGVVTGVVRFVSGS